MTIKSRDLKPGDRIRPRGRPGDSAIRTIKARKDDDSGWWIENGGGLADAVFDRDTRDRWEKVDMVTITVERDDILRLAGPYYGGPPFGEAAQRVLAAIPEPEWEPSEEQIKAYILWNWGENKVVTPIVTGMATGALKRMRKIGLLP